MNPGIISLPTSLSRSKCKSLIFYEHISGMLLGNAFRRGGHSANPPFQPSRVDVCRVHSGSFRAGG